MRILLTGCAGFIGSHVTDRLLAEKHEVIGVDNFDKFYNRNIKEGNIASALKDPNFTFYENDITESNFFHPFLHQKIDAIIHLADKAGVRPSMLDPIGYNNVNLMGTTHVFEYARQQGIQKVVFASSSSVYGVNKILPWSVDDKDLQPISIYAYSKQSGEKLCELYQEYFGLNITALRFFTVFGPRQRPDLAIHKFVRSISNDEQVTLYGTGQTFRDYTFIDDIVSGVIGALHYDNRQFEVFNLGNSHTVSLIDLIRIIEDLMGKKANIVHMPEQQGDVPYTWSNIEKSERMLGYQPKTDIREGISKFIEWYNGIKTVVA